LTFEKKKTLKKKTFHFRKPDSNHLVSWIYCLKCICYLNDGSLSGPFWDLSLARSLGGCSFDTLIYVDYPLEIPSGYSDLMGFYSDLMGY